MATRPRRVHTPSHRPIQQHYFWWQVRHTFALYCSIQAAGPDSNFCAVDSWDMQHLQQNLVTRGLIVTKDIDEERIMRGPLIKLPHTIRITTELAKQKLAPILQAAGLPDVQDTKNSAIMAGTVSCQVC